MYLIYVCMAVLDTWTVNSLVNGSLLVWAPGDSGGATVSREREQLL